VSHTADSPDPGDTPETRLPHGSGDDHNESAAIRARFEEQLGFEPDDFQAEAFDAVEAGHHVLVAAPTGSGKTVVASFAAELALDIGRRLFYTTPIKALSNQKFHELVERYGPHNVGLLTGDNSINPDAPVVVMTTEVLRNMLYTGNNLDHLVTVVLDEVHYLQDAYRGAVWEEVIIHLPQHVRLVCLSATVSNAQELNDWIETVRGTSTLVVETERPVRLENRYMAAERANSHMNLIAVAKGAKPNPKGFRFDIDPRDLHRKGHGVKGRRRPPRRFRTPDRLEVALLLQDRNLLPAIHFIFSRAACDDAARSALGTGTVFTSRAEQVEIEEIVRSKVSGLSRTDLDILGFGWFVEALKAGFAPHHAGMVPPFKEAVEACFEQGLLKMVYATETLALGVNMPARTVVIEKLTKFTGDHHEMLTPAQYTQLTGRAGRRGIDTEGTAVVLWSPFVRFKQVAELALSRQFALRSSFRPTYNMAANLVRRYSPDESRKLLNLSFAQFQSDSGVVRSEQRIEKLRDRQRQVAGRIERDFGPVEVLRAALVRGKGPEERAEVAAALQRLRPGDVIRLDSSGPALAVVAVAARSKGRVHVKAVSGDGDVSELSPLHLDATPQTIGQIALPDPYLPNSVTFAHETARVLGKSRFPDVNPSKRESAVPISRHEVPPAAHKQLRRLERIEDDIERALGVGSARAHSLAATFDRVIELLARRGHVVWGQSSSAAGHRARGSGDDFVLPVGEGTSEAAKEWGLTPSGQRLARLYNEADLLIVEALEEGLFDGLNPAEMAALASAFIFENRSNRSDSQRGKRGDRRGRDREDEVWFPTRALRERYERLEGLHTRLVADESALLLPESKRPDPGFMALAHGWTAGGTLGHVLDDEDITAGDFVRVCKQLIDLLRQLAVAVPGPVGRTARQGADAMFRDLLAAAVMPDG